MDEEARQEEIKKYIDARGAAVRKALETAAKLKREQEEQKAAEERRI